MKLLQKINKELKHGDQETISALVGCSTTYVNMVLSGRREHGKGKGKMVVEVAAKLISKRDLMILEIETELKAKKQNA